jgi:hypothetical protein
MRSTLFAGEPMTRSWPIRAVPLCLAASLVFMAPARAEPAPPQVLTLRLQQAGPPMPTEVQLQFVGYRDTRCPSDVTCAVAGEATAFLWATGPAVKPQLVALDWDGGSEQLARHGQVLAGHRVYLVSLEPRPRQSGPVDPGEYTAVVKVFPAAGRLANPGREVWR